MKIAMIGSRGVGSNYGGIERVLDELCPRLAVLGHEVDVFSRVDIEAAGPAKAAAEEAEAEQPLPSPAAEFLPVKSIPTKSFGGKHLENLSRSMTSTFKALHRYDLVHFHATGPGMFSAVTRAARQKSVVTIHALDQRRQKWGPAAKLSLQLAERTITSCADEITVVSESLRRYMREKYDYHARYIPNGIPRRQSVAPGALLQKHQLEAGRYFLFASRLTPEKGCHDLIAAFSRTTTPMKLAIAGGVGPAEYADKLKRIADPDRVVFLGHLGGTELAEAFSNAYVFVLPSYIEGMSMALLEAISFGIPALVSDIEENLLVLAGRGFHFSVGNVSSLEALLSLLAAKPALVQAEASALKDLPLPNWDDIAGRYDQFYRRLCDASAMERR
ncbi:MAG TPA: glycosyltransferase family 4 protein [Dongiaceae bacterium]|nr:glycosyltransferase family 4 protein [Dongiaceae bacterium]